MQHKFFIKYSWFLVGMVFLVILAGGVVRMTQSGMGCPDWPKCFGMWIPPTDASQLPPDFEKYLDKQDIDHSFNVYHTWIEYINRLLGAILGLFILINMGWALRKYWSNDKVLVATSLFLLIAVGFQGWLGKLVVDSNLSVFKITIHMLVAILIAIVPLYNIARLRGTKYTIPKHLNIAIYVIVGLLITQIVLGTQVREQIDEISKGLAYEQRSLWISRLDNMFVVHRSFSWLILICGAWLWYKGRNLTHIKNYVNALSFGIVATILVGVVMAYLDMPAIAQPMHLVLACAMVCTGFYTLFRTVS